MPIREFECNRCGCIIEKLIISHEIQTPRCQVCGNRMKQIISLSSFSLKGECWTKDGYSKKEINCNGESDSNTQTRKVHQEIKKPIGVS